MAQVLHVTDDDIADIRRTSRSLIKFGATWCGPCKLMDPKFEEVALECSSPAKFFSVDVDECPQLSKVFGIRGVPTIVVVEGNDEVARLVGNVSKEKIVALCRE
jgi:thioredoxin 1